MTRAPAAGLNRVWWASAVLALILSLGLAVDAALLISNYQVGQAALNAAAEAAATAVEPAADTGWELRLEDSADQPSAYTLAAAALGAARARVTIRDVVSDGRRVLVRGEVAAPTLLVRWFGLTEITFSLVATADLRPPSLSP